MGKASSSKKVARAARAGGSLRERPKLGFPLAIFAIIVIGSGLVFYARADRVDAAQATTAPVANKDHWHAAYGIYVCDHWLTPLTDIPGKADANGIHTHGDGVMHVHPFTAAASGKKATIGQWADMTGMKINNDSFEVAGVKYANGFDCNGKPANVYVIRWADAFDPMSTGEVFTSGFPDILYRNDKSAIVFARPPRRYGLSTQRSNIRNSSAASFIRGTPLANAVSVALVSQIRPTGSLSAFNATITFQRPSRMAFCAILSCRLLAQILGRIGSSGVLTSTISNSGSIESGSIGDSRGVT